MKNVKNEQKKNSFYLATPFEVTPLVHNKCASFCVRTRLLDVCIVLNECRRFKWYMLLTVESATKVHLHASNLNQGIQRNERKRVVIDPIHTAKLESKGGLLITAPKKW